MSDRIFYELLKRVGAQHHHQTISLIFISSMMMVTGSSLFFNAYLFYEEKYSCPEFEVDCQKYVCSLPPHERTKFEHSTITNLATIFGDYRCDSPAYLDNIQSLINIGGILGLTFGTILSQIFTVRLLLILAAAGNCFGIMLAILCGSQLFITFGLFINMAAVAIELNVIFCYITETTDEQIRGKHTIIIYISQGLGATLNGLIFYILEDWKLFLTAYVLIPSLISLFGLLFYLEQTTFDLVTNFTPQESFASLNRIAKRNGLQYDHGITVQELRGIKEEYELNLIEHSDNRISVLYLFKFKSLRLIAILSIFIQFILLYQFSAPQLAISGYSESIYVNGVLIGLSQLLASILCYFLVDHYRRKKIIYITQTISLIISLLILIFYSCQESDHCTDPMMIMQSIGLFIFRFTITISYNFIQLIQFEMFPGQIRDLALQVTSIFSFLALVIAPQIIGMFERWGISIVSTFAISCIIVILLIIKLPETYGIEPPEMIEQLNYTKKSHRVIPICQEIEGK